MPQPNILKELLIGKIATAITSIDKPIHILLEQDSLTILQTTRESRNIRPQSPPIHSREGKIISEINITSAHLSIEIGRTFLNPQFANRLYILNYNNPNFNTDLNKIITILQNIIQITTQ